MGALSACLPPKLINILFFLSHIVQGLKTWSPAAQPGMERAAKAAAMLFTRHAGLLFADPNCCPALQPLVTALPVSVMEEDSIKNSVALVVFK